MICTREEALSTRKKVSLGCDALVCNQLREVIWLIVRETEIALR